MAITIENFHAWLHRDIVRFGKFQDHIEVLEGRVSDEPGLKYRIHIYTDVNCFAITAVNPAWVLAQDQRGYRRDEPPEMPGRASVDPRLPEIRLAELRAGIPDGSVHEAVMDNGYLGCIGSVRKPRAGETWHRGSDLADGPLTEETWHRILGDIVSYEMVKVHRPREPIGVPSVPSG